MDEVLTELIARLGQKVPELRLIDEDYGQLEPNSDDQYPVVFPCVLLSAVGVEWADMGIPGPNVQRGTAEITVRLAIDCYDDTHARVGNHRPDRRPGATEPSCGEGSARVPAPKGLHRPDVAGTQRQLHDGL